MAVLDTRPLRPLSNFWLRATAPTLLPPVGPAEESNSALAGALVILKRHYVMLGAMTAAGMLAGLFYAASVTPAYRATATIEVQDLNENFLNFKDVASAQPTASVATDLQTQIRILQSRTLIARVLQRIGLPHQPAVNGGAAPTDLQVETAGRNLQVRETRQSRIVDVTFESADPGYAAAFVNNLAQQYIDQSVEARLDISRGTSSWLERQLQDLRSKLTESEGKLQSYARDSGLLVTNDAQRPDELKLQQVQANLSQAQENRMAKEARRDMAANAPLDSLEPPLGSALRDHRAKLADLRRQRADLVAVYTAEFGPVKRVDAQIADMEGTVSKEAAAVLQGINNDYVDALRRERLLEQSYQSQVQQVSSKATKAIQYGILKNEVDSSRELYNTMLQRAAEAKVASALRASSARVVDQAKAPRVPFWPSRLLTLASGGTAGLLLALVLIVGRDRFAHQVVSRDDLVAVSRVPELGMITDGRGPDAYRAILTSILFSPQARGVPKVIAVTSIGSGEGKSELVFRLAGALSKMNRTVLMIDGSRNGGLQKLFGQTLEYGLRDLMELPDGGRNMFAYMTNATSLAGVHLASLGENASVLDLVFPQGVEHLMTEMRRNYDVVFIDTPALAEFPDACVFAKMADGVVLVVKAGKNSAAEVRSAVKRLQWDETVLLGTVLNRS